MPWSRRSSFLVALLIVAVPTVLGAQVPTSSVAALDPVIDGDATSLTITLKNNTALAVTAWGLEITVRSDDRVRVESRSVDGYDEIEGIAAGARPRVVRAYGQSKPQFSYQRRYWPFPVVSVSVALKFVIFEDGTTLGAESGIATVFKDRADAARVLNRVRSALLGVGGAVSGQAALERAISELEFPDDGTPADVHARAARQNVARALGRVKAGSMSGGEIGTFVRSLLEHTTAKTRAAEKHAVRR